MTGKKDHLKLQLDGYKKLCIKLEDAALQEGSQEWKKVCDEADEYFDLEYEADSAVSWLGSCLTSIQEKLERNLKVSASRTDASLVAEILKLGFRNWNYRNKRWNLKSKVGNIRGNWEIKNPICEITNTWIHEI